LDLADVEDFVDRYVIAARRGFYGWRGLVADQSTAGSASGRADHAACQPFEAGADSKHSDTTDQGGRQVAALYGRQVSRTHSRQVDRELMAAASAEVVAGVSSHAATAAVNWLHEADYSIGEA
jgi:hypothetical protein